MNTKGAITAATSHRTKLRTTEIVMNSRIVQLMMEEDIKHLMIIAIHLTLVDGTRCAMTSNVVMELAAAIGNGRIWIIANMATSNNQGFHSSTETSIAPTRMSTTILQGKVPRHRSIGKSQYVDNSPLQVVQLQGTSARIRIGSTIVSSSLRRARTGASRTSSQQGTTERTRTDLYASTEDEDRGRPPEGRRPFFKESARGSGYFCLLRTRMKESRREENDYFFLTKTRSNTVLRIVFYTFPSTFLHFT
jgi:hypothetical protein